MMEYGLNNGWVIRENEYLPTTFGKTESILTIGNGYFSNRAYNEEYNIMSTRNNFINGYFTRENDQEVVELPNLPDALGIRIWVDNTELSFEKDIISYLKELNLEVGILSRSIVLSLPKGKLNLNFERFIPLNESAHIYSKLTINADYDCEIKVENSINGRTSNSGGQHFYDGVKTVDGNTLKYYTQTNDKSRELYVNTKIDYDFDKSLISIDRRFISLKTTKKVNANENVDIYQYTAYSETEFDDTTTNYETAKNEHLLAWENYWNESDIVLEGNNYAQTAIRFALYHLRINNHFESDLSNIGAKGLTGEGYKGHTFWDTEIFLLPFYIYTHPIAARNLLMYRYKLLESARKKAHENGYLGAMYPWESASIEFGEVTPKLGRANVITGVQEKILTGDIEQHVTGDVAYGVMHYYNVTKDEEFLKKYGSQIIKETAIFWMSRVDENFEILNVIGPDEYKESVNNNAFTNYIAKYNIDTAIKLFSEGYFTDFDIEKAKYVSENIKLQKENEDKIIPQDDTFMDLERIDLKEFKNQSYIGSFNDKYNFHQRNQIAVCKQADVVQMMLMFDENFTEEVKVVNFDFYESVTLHDSSLSLGSFSTLAYRLNKNEIADNLFLKSLDVDLSSDYNTSNPGIHIASLGGIWQNIVFGMCNLKLGEEIQVTPNLHSSISKVEFKVVKDGKRYNIIVSKDSYEVVEV